MSLPATVSTLLTAMESATTRIAMSDTGGRQFLKLSKQGFWVYGADETEVEEGSKWAINPEAFAMGFACWGDGELIDEAMALITEDPIIKSSLPTHNKPWAEQVGLQLACISGEDTGTLVSYTATSFGGKKAFNALILEVVERAKQGNPAIVPHVELDVDSYKHKKYGKVFTPEFTIVGWSELTSTVPSFDEPEEEEQVDEGVIIEPPVTKEPKQTRRRRATA